MSQEITPRSPLCQSHREETASTLTHAAGVALGIAALTGMLVTARGNPLETISSAVFGSSLVLLYLFSTLYHFSTTERAKRNFQALDHAAIFLLIAGSYTPILLVALPGARGWTLLAVVWCMAVIGVFVKTALPGKKGRWPSTLLYLVMGWLILFVIGPLARVLPAAGIAWLVAGGVTYTLGIVFYQWRKLPYHHAVWHLFVLGGSACHVVAIWGYVLR